MRAPVFICPRTRGPLREWTSPDGHTTYPLLDGIPVLVPDPAALLRSNTARSVGSADPRRLGLPDAITPHLPPSLFSAPGGFGQWLASLADHGPDPTCALLAGHHAPAGPALDVGCGVGTMTRRMVAVGRATWAFDLAPDAVLLARGLLCGALPQTTIPTHKGGIRRVKIPFKPIQTGLSFCIADATTPPFEDEAFAWVHLGNLLDGLGDALPDVLVSCVAMLARGGLMTLSTPYGAAGGASETAASPDEELLEALDGLGLAVVEQQASVPAIERQYDRSYAVRFMHCVAARKR